jgi:hypothetical protein
VISPLPFRVIPCTEWGAAQPKGALSRVGKPVRTIFHHTAGHVPNLSAGETYEEARAYARAIQRSHFRNGWLDSGHNFLVTRGGYILEGRHRSLAEIRAGKMVASAHCLGQNDQPGIEHEQVDPQALTPIQRRPRSGCTLGSARSAAFSLPMRPSRTGGTTPRPARVPSPGCCRHSARTLLRHLHLTTRTNHGGCAISGR